METFPVPLANVRGLESSGAATACQGRHFSMAALRSRLEGALRSQPEVPGEGLPGTGGVIQNTEEC